MLSLRIPVQPEGQNESKSRDNGGQDRPSDFDLHASSHESNLLSASLIAQRFNRVEQRSLSRRVVAKKHSDGN
jgi:hypothetical protein